MPTSTSIRPVHDEGMYIPFKIIEQYQAVRSSLGSGIMCVLVALRLTHVQGQPSPQSVGRMHGARWINVAAEGPQSLQYLHVVAEKHPKVSV